MRFADLRRPSLKGRASLPRVLSLLALSLLGMLALPSVALSPDLPPQGTLYLGGGKILEAARPRQMTLNANVLGFLYQPGGLSLAYMGVSVNGDAVTQSIRLIGLKRGEGTTLVSTTAQVGPDGAPADPQDLTLSTLAGWSGDGRYLLIEQARMGEAPKNADGLLTRKTFVCVDVGANPVRLLAVPLPAITPSAQSAPEYGGFTWQSWWAPGRTRLLFAARGIVREGDSEPPRMKDVIVSAVVYDPARQQVTPLPVPGGALVSGWMDDDHVLMNRQTGGKTRWIACDAGTGAPRELPGLPNTAGGGPGAFGAGPSPKDPRLMLDVEERFHPDKQRVTGIDSHLLWVRRAGGLKKASALPVGLTPDHDDPQAHWSPTGQQIAFVSHGDLFVTNLSVRDADPREKLAAGDKLSCPEEQALAQSNLKQIGLGFMQYAQDYDEQFPPPADVNNSVMPYLKTSSLFSLGDSRFVYVAPPSLSLASMESPAELVLGTLDTPCAHNVLYADGHVKSFPKPPKE